MRFQSSDTIGDVVASDHRTAGVFQKHGLDFCCGGKRTIEEACRRQGLAPSAVLADLSALPARDADVVRFDRWSPDALIEHILTTHHPYVRRTLPVLTAYTTKLVEVHGSRHPELHEIAARIADVRAELDAHMFKEEHVLFPYIRSIAAARREQRPAPPCPFGTIANPIAAMEAEHEIAGDAMAAVRRLTHDYTPPADACTTYRVCFQELKDFERDLHQHVHLENNILFPKALRLEAAVMAHAV